MQTELFDKSEFSGEVALHQSFPPGKPWARRPLGFAGKDKTGFVSCRSEVLPDVHSQLFFQIDQPFGDILGDFIGGFILVEIAV